ncbi:MAG: ATP-dependent sacrificial sulfur transferase LarE [Firmicutes bacterium]|nr:ATP-dependent sacrificial sulfur transferase LarE [Bacillota bacterium]
MNLQKIERIKGLISGLGSVVVALSGGVDSSVMLRLSIEALGTAKVLAATYRSEISPTDEINLAAQIADYCGVRHEIVPVSDLESAKFAANPPDRCYFCKFNSFTKLKKLAEENGFNAVVDGTNKSDTGDHRPGIKALRELGVKSPLMECDFTKEEIRELAVEFKLPNWNRPSNACLASRFPYGTPISLDNVAKVAGGEALLRSMGFTQFRLRHHGSIARIEINTDEFFILMDQQKRELLVDNLRALGYVFVTVDLGGYRTGSLNELL